MKKEIIQVIFLALIIMVPLAFASIVQLNGSKNTCELAEIPSEEEQKGEQETEVEDVFDEFLIHNHFNVTIIKVKKLQLSENHTFINSAVREVVTPPPELV